MNDYSKLKDENKVVLKKFNEQTSGLTLMLSKNKMMTQLVIITFYNTKAKPIKNKLDIKIRITSPKDSQKSSRKSIKTSIILAQKDNQNKRLNNQVIIRTNITPQRRIRIISIINQTLHMQIRIEIYQIHSVTYYINYLMQLTSPIKQAESHYINLPVYSNYSNQPQSMKSPNSVLSVNNSTQQVFKSESKSQNMVQSQISGPHIEFDSTDPIQVQCDNCHTFSSSLVYIENTKYTYIFAVLLILICLCWVPFVLKKFFMKISHVCPGCDRVVGQYDYMANKFDGLF